VQPISGNQEVISQRLEGEADDRASWVQKQTHQQ